MRFIIYPAGLALLCALVPAASAAPTLTLEAAIQRAVDHHPGVRAASRERDIAAGQRLQAGAMPNPELSYLSEGIRHAGRTTTILLSQAIELGGKRGARITLAERERDIATLDLFDARSQLRFEVVSAFFDVLAGQQAGELAQASLALAQQVTSIVGKRVTAGKVSPVDATRARVAEASAKIELSQATAALTLARIKLAATWGSVAPEADALVAPAAPFGTAPVPGASPQIARARGEAVRQQAMADVERSRRIPDLTLSLGTKRDEQSGVRQAVVGVAIPLPLFDNNQGNLLSALRRTDKARDALLAVENDVAVSLAQATLRRDAAMEELAILEADILPGAQSAYDASTRGFELGKFSFIDVLDAQRTLFQAKNQALRALAASHRAAAEIDRIAVPHKETP